MTRRAASLFWCGVLILAARTAAAQESPHEIATALAAEQARISELKAELDRRSAALADLARRLDALGAQPTPPPSTPTAPAQAAAAKSEEPVAPSYVSPRFQLYGDAKVRFETLNQDYDGCVGCPDRKRGRLRLRFGAEGQLSPDFTAAMGFAVGELNDPNSVYQNLGNNFSRKVATWDRGYVQYHPTKAPSVRLTAGKFWYTWLRSSMTFDVDFYPEGMSEQFSFDLKHAGVVKNVGVTGFQLIANEQPGDQHMTVVGTQATAKFQFAPRVTTLLAVTGVDIERPEFMLRNLLDGTDVGVKNTNAIVTVNGVAFLVSRYRYANAILENAITTPWEKLPVTLGVEYQYNMRAASNRDAAVSFRVDAGRAQRGGDWLFAYHLFRVEQDAILAGLGESDWRAPSNVLQQRIGVDRMLNPNVQLSFTLYSGHTIDTSLPGALLAPGLSPGMRDPWTNRVYIDITYKY